MHNSEGLRTDKNLTDLYLELNGQMNADSASKFDFYEQTFRPFRDSRVRLLEIGAREVGSLEIWSRFFRDAECIVGCYSDPALENLRFADKRISLVVGDAGASDCYNRIRNIASEYDIIIVDGSEKPRSIIRLFAAYFPIVAECGVYIANGLHHSSKTICQGGVETPYSTVDFFKGLADFVNREHCGASAAPETALSFFRRGWQTELDGPSLERVAQVTFRNSLCVVSKGGPKSDASGPHIVAGAAALPAPKAADTNGDACQASDETGSQFAPTAPRLEELTARCFDLQRELQAERKRRDDLVAALNQADRDRWELDKRRLELEAEAAGFQPYLIKADAERTRLLAMISELENARSQLVAELSRAYRRPLRPLKFMAKSAFLKALAKIVRPFSDRSAERFERSSAKRGPDRFNRPLAEPIFVPPPAHVPANHDDWVREFDTPDGRTLQNFVRTAAEIPNVLIVVEFETGDLKLWNEVVDSLRDLIGVTWRAIFKLRKSSLPNYLSRTISSEPRIQTLDDGIEIHEEIIIHAHAGAVLRPHGARLLADALLRQSDAILAYGDEDTKRPDKTLSDPWFKPVFSPLLARQGLLLGRVVALRPSGAAGAKALADALLREDGSSRRYLIDFAVEAGASRVVSVPHIISHNTLAPPAPLALARPPLPDILPIVSIVIATRDRWDLLSQCLESLYVTDWPREKLEIIVVDNGSTEPECVAGLNAAGEAGKIVVERDDGPFNFSRLNNRAAQRAKGELLVLLNNDTKATTTDWLKEMAAYALLPDAGVVGPKLLYDDDTVQHGGVIVGVQGLAAHAHLRLARDEGGYQNLANVTREILSVTGACIAVRKSKYLEIGGMNETFQVAFGDTVLCLDLHARGYTNYFVHKALFYHFESKTRGYDDTDAKRLLARREAIQAWRLHKPLLQEDPFYSPNLSLEETYLPSFAPRRRPWWRSREGRPQHVLMLSWALKMGHGVPVVMAQHARGLIERGYRVSVGGPASDEDFEFPDCHRLDVEDPRLAMRWAIKNDVDVIIVHSPPFYSVARWAGRAIPVIAYDHGEPPPERFDDAAARHEVLREKNFCLHMCAKVYTISEAIKAESRTPVDGVIRLGNTHLGQWNATKAELRRRVRAENGWSESFVVLNVARFHAAEQRYKGIDHYLETMRILRAEGATTPKPVVFVLCGKGDENEISLLRRSGVDVRAGVSDAELEELYAAADAYANFSQWEGYNLGIGQALAMGLPVVASDIPAHRAFGVVTVDSPAGAAQALANLISALPSDRTPRLWNWEEPLDKLAAEIDGLCEQSPGSNER